MSLICRVLAFNHHPPNQTHKNKRACTCTHSTLDKDRFMGPDIEAAVTIVKEGQVGSKENPSIPFTFVFLIDLGCCGATPFTTGGFKRKPFSCGATPCTTRGAYVVN